MNYLGEIASIITSFTFAVNSTLFTLAGRRVGSAVVNRIRLIAAFLFLVLAHLIFLGTIWPGFEEPGRWFWFGLSGVIGYVVGDAFLFQAFLWVGPRISMLMMSLAPVISLVIAWVFMGEQLSPGQLLGILLTLLGVIWVVLEKNQRGKTENANHLKGILFGLGGAVGQALGFVLSKQGLDGGYSPISGNYIRMITALVVMWLVTIIQGKAAGSIKAVIEDQKALLKIIGGAFSGPFLGVSLSLFALQYTTVGVASTLMALPPVVLLPVDYFYFKERFGWGAVAGTLVALSGVAVIFLT
jgi:drug/metabolite transporter (DMT)-like permease